MRNDKIGSIIESLVQPYRSIVTEGGTYYFHSKKEWDEFLKNNPQYKNGDLKTGKKGGKYVVLKGDTKKREISAEQEKEFKKQSEKVASDRIDRAKKSEPVITSTLDEVVKAAGGDINYGGHMLDYKTKTAESLARKILTDVKESGMTPEEAEEHIYDVNRYTSICNEENMTDSVDKTLKGMESKGFKTMRVKNTLQDENAPYRGVNCVLQSPDGTMFELQFHTPKSLEIKEVNHKLYEEQRLDDTSEERREELSRIMAENAKSIPTPKNIGNIGSFSHIEESLQRLVITT